MKTRRTIVITPKRDILKISAVAFLLILLLIFFYNHGYLQKLKPILAAIDPEEEKSGLKLVENNESFYMAVDGDEDCLMHLRRKVKDFLEAEGEGFCGLPVLMDEWSNNIWQRDLCNDTCYKSAYLFKSIMENHDSYYGLGYFSISDQLDEIAPAAEAFHGGFGLFT